MNAQIEARNARTGWFREARFGMFIHWGLYAIPGRGEWMRWHEKQTDQQYQRYFDAFDPVDYDPREWARLAKRAGMKYAVLTTKHHEGFCLFDSQLTDFKSTNTRCGRDLVREYVDAFRAEGIKVGFYHSLFDWHHPDYPHYGHYNHPMRDNEAYKDHQPNLDRYLAYLHGQVRELLTNYGKIDILWFDYSSGDMHGEAWKATELVNMIRSLQPDILINNRLERNNCDDCTFLSEEPTVFAGDFTSPEQVIPARGLLDVHGDPVPWEACCTLNDHWGYCAADDHWKSPRMVVRMLTECVSKGGNLLLNVGPDARGRIPKKSVEILEAVGDWMADNAESIYGCGRADLPKPEWGRYTRRGNTLYAHVYEECMGPVCLQGLAGRIESGRLLADRSEIQFDRFWNLSESLYKDDAFFYFDKSRARSFPLPDDRDTVVEITLREEENE